MIGSMKYCFPKMFKGQTFDSIQYVQAEITDQAYNVGCQGMENIMKWIRYSDDQIRLNCQSCLASIIFQQDSNGVLTVSMANNIHIHLMNLMTDEENRFAQLAGQIVIAPSTVESAEQQPLKKPQPQLIIPSEPIDITKLFIPYVKQGWHIIMQQQQQNNITYPSLVVFSTFKRHNTLSFFSDCVGIYLLPQQLPVQQISLRYRVCLLISFDYKMAPIITAVGLISDSTTASCYKMFNCFMKFAQNKVKSVVMNDDPLFLSMLRLKEQLNERKQVILLDPEIVKKKVNQLAMNHPKFKEIEDLVVKLLKQRQQIKGQMIIKKLQAIHQRWPLTSLLEYLNQNSSRVYLWRMPHIFIGLNFTAIDFINSPTIKYMTSSNLKEFLERFQKQDENYTGSRPTMYNTPIEQAYEDPKLKVVRLSIEAPPFEQFMRTYLKATSNQPHNYTVNQHSGKCSCGYKLQTGLPCVHLLKQARKISVLPYCDMVAKRWKRYEYLMLDKEVELLDELY